jgi:hypothetical protein
MTDFTKPEETALNPIQPVSDDFSTDGYLPEFAKIDHQHPLSESLRQAIFNAGVGTYVLKTGDTMSGNLTMNGNVILNGSNYISFNSLSNRIYYLSSPGATPWMVGPRIIGETGFSFYNAAQGIDVLGYRGASAYYMWIANKLIVGSTPSDAMAYQALNVNGHISMQGTFGVGWSSYYNAAAIWMQDSTWVRVTPNLYSSGIIGGNAGISAGGAGGSMGGYTGLYCPGTAYHGTTTFVGHVTGSGIMFQSTRTGTLAWGDSPFFANPGATRAQYCMHPGGVAGNLRMDQSFASFLCVDLNGTAYYSVSASAFAVGSKRSYKQDIKDWPPKPGPGLSADEQPIKAMDLVRELNIVSYRRKEEQLMAQTWKTERRNQAHSRLNRFRENRGLEPYPYEIHSCDDPICDGTLESPCAWKKNWAQEQLGLIVEDTIGIAPEIIQYDQKGEAGFIDVHSHVSLLHAAIKELEERIYFLERVS